MDSASFETFLHWVGSLGLLAAYIALMPSRKRRARTAATRVLRREVQGG